MNIAGLCAICGTPTTETCRGCGRGNCGSPKCKTGFVCNDCAKGRQA